MIVMTFYSHLLIIVSSYTLLKCGEKHIFAIFSFYIQFDQFEKVSFISHFPPPFNKIVFSRIQLSKFWALKLLNPGLKSWDTCKDPAMASNAAEQRIKDGWLKIKVILG